MASVLCQQLEIEMTMNAALTATPEPLAAPADLADLGVLRFITAGSVDDGKSTLIGRLLYDTRSVLVDQLQALARAGQARSAARVATAAADAAVDLSLLTDGLEAEREQGITIDVAYRYFATARRKFIIADTPGHEQYTRNMVTGASTADAAVILIDAARVPLDADSRVELLPQTRRHSALVHLLGIRHVLVAVNKMDALDFDPARFDAIVAAYRALAQQLGLREFTAVPISALAGDNVVRRSARTPWYCGPALLEWLEQAGGEGDCVGGSSAHPARSAAPGAPLRLAVQGVRKGEPRSGAGARGYTGRIGVGQVSVGQAVRVLPAGAEARVAAIETFDGDLEVAVAGQSVALRLDREVDVSRGDWIVAAEDHAGPQPRLARALRAHLAWLDHEPLAQQRKLWLRHGTRFVLARVTAVERVLDLASADWRAPTATTLRTNDIARVLIETQQPLAFDPYAQQRVSGAIVLVDATSHRTVAAGMLLDASPQAAPALQEVAA